jgi:hypothetical protein
MNFLLEIDYEDIERSASKMVGLLERNKVVVLKSRKGYRRDAAPLQPWSHIWFEELVDGLGKIIPAGEDVKTGESTGERWINICYDPEIKDKYRTASVSQPLHTDGSYENYQGFQRLEFIYCVNQAPLGGATTFIDSRLLVDLLKADGENDLIELLQSTEVVHAKDYRKKTLPILTKEGSDWRLNWNYQPALRGENNAETMEVVNRFHNFLENKVSRGGVVTPVTLKRNDSVFFHDELILHGRDSFFASKMGQRHLNKGTLILESRLDKNLHI